MRHHWEEYLDLDPFSPFLAKRHQASVIQLRLAFSELKRFLVGLGMRIRWEDGLGGFSLSLVPEVSDDLKIHTGRRGREVVRIRAGHID